MDINKELSEIANRLENRKEDKTKGGLFNIKRCLSLDYKKVALIKEIAALDLDGKFLEYNMPDEEFLIQIMNETPGKKEEAFANSIESGKDFTEALDTYLDAIEVEKTTKSITRKLEELDSDMVRACNTLLEIYESNTGALPIMVVDEADEMARKVAIKIRFLDGKRKALAVIRKMISK